ncbi:MAG: MMPL family transporter, partial [Myxococcales bacterium]|nr:MMPL family transporter [Myxococcales bacterium]
TEALEASPYVTAVLGPPGIHRDLAGEAPPDAFRGFLLDTPFYRRLLVSDEGDTAGLLLATDLGDDPAAPGLLVEAIGVAVTPLRDAGFRVHVVGPPVLNAALDGGSQREAQRSFPPAFALSILLLALLFRCARTTAVAVACAALTSLLTFGAIGLSGVPLNMVTSVLPSLLWVLSLAGATHVLRRFQAHRGNGAPLEPALELALVETAWPCILSALTTALGFAALLAATMGPVRELGAFAALGLLFSLLANLAVGPVLLRWLRPAAPPHLSLRRRLSDWQRLPFEHPRAIGAGAAVLAAAALLGISQIRIESDPLSFLPPESSLVRDYAAVSRDLTGYYALETTIALPEGESWLTARHWPAIERVERALAADPGVARVLSPLDLLRQGRAWREGSPGAYVLPEDEGEARRLMTMLGAGTDLAGFPLVSQDGRTVRLAALVKVMPSDAFGAIEARARAAVAALPPPLSGTVTGIVPQLVEAQRSLVETQIRSFGFAFLTIFACLAVGFRSLRLVAISVPANLLPIAAALAAMGFAGIALDAATVMMASVALGIAVDDTVHVLAAYDRADGTRRRRARHAAAEVGPAMGITTAVACVGFLTLRLSEFMPIRWFGMLSALAVTAALAADAWLVPALLAWGEASEAATTPELEATS